MAQTTYTYDVEHQLTRIDLPEGRVATYRYDALGRRIEKDVAGTIQRFLYDQEDLLQVYDASGCWQQGFLHGPGLDQPLSFVQDSNGDCGSFDAVGFREQIRFLQTDGLGSLTSLVSETSGFIRTLLLKERYAYDAFGTPTLLGPGPDGTMDTADDVRLAASALGNPFLFTGREYDPESGLYYYRRRYYDPGTGRFLQPDPVEFSDRHLNLYRYVGSVGKPLPYFKPINETNPYLYTGNNPITRIDPLGLWYVDVNFGFGFGPQAGFFGLTGGWIISPQGIYGYAGGGLSNLGPSGSITWSPGQAASGLTVGGQFGVGFAYQKGYGFGQGGGPFWEAGIGTPSVAATAYYVGEPWVWPWLKKKGNAACPK